jgi:predicted ATPase
MALSSEMRKLENKWATRGSGQGWPKFLDFIEIDGLRGWKGQRIEFPFPIVAIVGENGSGKSTILQCAASVYQKPRDADGVSRFASDYFPNTPWEELSGITIRFSYKQNGAYGGSIRKPTSRWNGNPDRPERNVDYIDLGRLQPVAARTGYRRLANAGYKEIESTHFNKGVLERFSAILGRRYESVRMALTDADRHRKVPVVGQRDGVNYSGFHQGAGEITIAELIQVEPRQYSLMLIDEIETSLHPRAQRRLIRDLADKCRQLDLQIILTTHSPYILEELPLDGRLYILNEEEKIVVRGVSPEFAMTKMDESIYPECDVYVEDPRSSTLLKEILVKYSKDSVLRCRFIPFGSAQVGASLGQMVYKNRFPRPSCVFLDGDQTAAIGCTILPGGDAPERVVFAGLETIAWKGIAERIGRPYPEVIDSCRQVMTYPDHKEWVRLIAEKLVMSSDGLWQALCSVWAISILLEEDARKTIKPIEDCLTRLAMTGPISPSEQQRLF